MLVVRAHLMAFVTRLRKAGVRISVAETIDAMAAVEAAGVERDVLREALAAALVKDERDRAAFDASFDEHFPLPAPDGSAGKGRRRGPRSGGEGAAPGGSSRGTGSAGGGTNPPAEQREPRAPLEARMRPVPPRTPSAPRADQARAQRPADSKANTRAGTELARADRATAPRRSPLAAARQAAQQRPGADTGTPAPPVSRRPFAELDPDQLDQARAAARELGRRFLARVSRRFRRTRRGRVDIRRTIRRAVARGGALIDLQRRGRRPGKPDLVVLCDVSGSVARASDLLLTMLAAAESAFARVTRFVFVDHLVPIDYVDGQIRPEGELDLYSYSDLGTVLHEIENGVPGLIDRRTVLLVLGDARNNRRPARADVLRRLALHARAIVWAVPEPRARWDTGDSALASYAESCDLVVEATSLTGLLLALRAAAR